MCSLYKQEVFRADFTVYHIHGFSQPSIPSQLRFLFELHERSVCLLNLRAVSRHGLCLSLVITLCQLLACVRDRKVLLPLPAKDRSMNMVVSANYRDSGDAGVGDPSHTLLGYIVGHPRTTRMMLRGVHAHHTHCISKKKKLLEMSNSFHSPKGRTKPKK